MATSQRIIWKAIQENCPRGRRIGLQEIYTIVKAHVTLKPDDFNPASKKGGIAWERNVRNVLQYRRQTREILWSGEHAQYMLHTSDEAKAILRELNRRITLWTEVKRLERRNKITAEVVNRLGLHRGQAGIYFDKRRTAPLSSHPGGVAVSVLPTGTTYPDELRDDGIIYHYPHTDRSGRHDQNEIQALKAAREVELPVFVIIPPTKNSPIRDVRLSWVVTGNDANKTFYIRFGNEPPTETFAAEPEQPFEPIINRKTSQRLVAGPEGFEPCRPLLWFSTFGSPSGC